MEPLPAAVNRVTVSVCSGLEEMLSVEPVVCSSLQLPTLARTKALQANVHIHSLTAKCVYNLSLLSLLLSRQFASMAHVSQSPSLSDHHPNNRLLRLRQIRRIRERCTPPSPATDFTSYS